MHAQIYNCIYTHIYGYRQLDTYTYIDGSIGRWTYGWTGQYIKGCVNPYIGKCMDIQMDSQLYQ